MIAIFVNRAYHQYTRGYNFAIRTTPQKKLVSQQWVIFFGLTYVFGRLGLVSDHKFKYP